MSSSLQTVQSNHDSALRARVMESRQLTDALFALIRPEALYERPIPARHRLIFYLGHLEAFDWNLIAGQAVGFESSHADLDKLFAFGIDPVDGGLPMDQPADWPRESEVRAYNANVRAQLDELLPETDSTLLHVAIEHRLMHAETLTYLLHQLPLDKTIHPQPEKAIAVPMEPPRLATIPAGTATLGQSRSSSVFGWDNEFEELRVSVPAFRGDVFPVTNAQFLQFVQAEGYNREEFWSAEDWAWKDESSRTHPCFWRLLGGDWHLRTMFAEVPLPPDWPVFVSHAEASAYARWANKRLPSEAQWHRMAYGAPDANERPYPWGNAAPDGERGNFNFARWDPTPAQAHPRGNSAFGIADLLGNGWEWTATPFQPLPGFRAFPFYPGYSADFFDGKHYVLKGGSPRTAESMLRRSFRNWFQPRYPYLYAKFRCVEE
jgi:gamma-glutamyl hercynylcysteine S-oxide synthase